MDTVVLDGDIGLNIVIDGAADLVLAHDGESGIVTQVHDQRPVYHGEVDITPGAEAVTLSTRGKLMTDDIIVEPIPENYGLIAWNGSTLTVS